MTLFYQRYCDTVRLGPNALSPNKKSLLSYFCKKDKVSTEQVVYSLWVQSSHHYNISLITIKRTSLRHAGTSRVKELARN